MDFRLILLLLTIVITGFLALFVYFRSPNNAVAKHYLLLITSFVTWALIRYIIDVTTDLNLALLLETASYVLGLGIGWTFLAFASAFPYPSKPNKKILTAILIFTVAAFLTVVKGDLVLGTQFAYYSKSFTIGFPALTLYNVVFSSLFLYA